MRYSKKVVDRFIEVVNNLSAHAVGRFDPMTLTLQQEWLSSTCGDVMKLDLKLDIDDKITDVKFKTYGCGSAIASSSLFVDMLIGKTVEESKTNKRQRDCRNT